MLPYFFQRRFRYPFDGEHVACNLCGGTDFDVVGRRDRLGGKLRTVLCRGCGLVFTNPMPTDDEVSAFYRTRYRQDYHGTSQPRPAAVARANKGAIYRYNSLKTYYSQVNRVLDVGSGSGELVAHLSRHGLDATGLEPNEKYARFSREQYDIKICNASWREAQFEPGYFDMISAIHVLEHFRDPGAALSQFKRWLRPDGFLFLSVPNIEAHHRSPHGRFHFAHLYNFNRDSLIHMVNRAGLMVHEEGVNRPTEIVFKNSDAPVDLALNPSDNYEKLRAFFDTHNSWNHYRTLTPYRRFVTRIGRRFAASA